MLVQFKIKKPIPAFIRGGKKNATLSRDQDWYL